MHGQKAGQGEDSSLEYLQHTKDFEEERGKKENMYYYTGGEGNVRQGKKKGITGEIVSTNEGFRQSQDCLYIITIGEGMAPSAGGKKRKRSSYFLFLNF